VLVVAFWRRLDGPYLSGSFVSVERGGMGERGCERPRYLYNLNFKGCGKVARRVDLPTFRIIALYRANTA